jgi:NAD(P)-dependent dehydrogenase (short-subunit alcohol dehydrogenase family)
VEAFTESVRTEVASHGVDLGTAYLSWTDTDMVRGADERSGLRESRSAMPGPLGKTYPLEPTVTAICDGIERRSAHVYGQRWVRAVRPLRGLLAGLTYTLGRRDFINGEKAFLASPDGDYGLVGAGGRADQQRATSASGSTR